MVVDDEPDIRTLVRVMLQGAGHTVVEAESGEDALRIVEQGAPTLALLDLRMPGMGGWAVLEALREQGLTEQLKVVIFSAHFDVAERARASEAGAAGFLTKPFTAEQLLATVERWLER
jgi:two-component system NtrC family response regulator